jgi:TetR/AcrR family transcriptional repressor of mexJK operon
MAWLRNSVDLRQQSLLFDMTVIAVVSGVKPLMRTPMVRTWSENDPKAGLMARKRAQIVAAARQAFLDEGYAGSSVNRIASAAGVSIKTLYRHFESKDDLFSAVMQAACRAPPDESEEGGREDWMTQPPERGIALAGEEYLRHALSPEQLALYRVVIRDAQRFPELGARYQAEVVGGREAIFADYLDRWAPVAGWKLRNSRQAAGLFAALLNAGTLDAALLGRWCPAKGEMAAHARSVADRLVHLLRAGLV